MTRSDIFQMHELDALLGDFKDDFDVDGIIQEATEVDPSDGNRYWTASGDKLAEIIERHELEGR